GLQVGAAGARAGDRPSRAGVPAVRVRGARPSEDVHHRGAGERGSVRLGDRTREERSRAGRRAPGAGKAGRMTEEDLFESIGEEGFARLIRAFYAQVPGDPLLGPMYP